VVHDSDFCARCITVSDKGSLSMVAGNVEFVFASRNERRFKQIEIKSRMFMEKRMLDTCHASMFCNQCKNLLEETYL